MDLVASAALDDLRKRLTYFMKEALEHITNRQHLPPDDPKTQYWKGRYDSLMLTSSFINNIERYGVQS